MPCLTHRAPLACFARRSSAIKGIQLIMGTGSQYSPDRKSTSVAGYKGQRVVEIQLDFKQLCTWGVPPWREEEWYSEWYFYILERGVGWWWGGGGGGGGGGGWEKRGRGCAVMQNIRLTLEHTSVSVLRVLWSRIVSYFSPGIVSYCRIYKHVLS